MDVPRRGPPRRRLRAAGHSPSPSRRATSCAWARTERAADRRSSGVLTTGVDERIREIKRTLAQERRTSWSHLKQAEGGLLPIVWIGIVLSVFQQFVGINVIFYYSSTLWQAVGFTEKDALLHHRDHLGHQHRHHPRRDRAHRPHRAPPPAADRLGGHGPDPRRDGLDCSARRRSSTASRCCRAPPAPPPWSPRTSTSSSSACRGDPVVWVLLGEMFNNRIRGLALGVAAAAQWLANFAISTTFPAMADLGPVVRLRLLHRDGPRLTGLRDPFRPGDSPQGARGHGVGRGLARWT